jgi:hypothetical protein
MKRRNDPVQSLICISTVFLVLIEILLFAGQLPVNAQDQKKMYLPIIKNCGPVAVLIKNGDFEQGAIDWVSDGMGLGKITDTSAIEVPPFKGNWMAYLISYGIIGIPDAYLEQTFSVPGCSPYLGFQMVNASACCAICGSRCGGGFSVSINGNTVISKYMPSSNLVWTKHTVDLQEYKGQTVKVRFTVGSFRTSLQVQLDDIAFQDHPEAPLDLDQGQDQNLSQSNCSR